MHRSFSNVQTYYNDDDSTSELSDYLLDADSDLPEIVIESDDYDYGKFSPQSRPTYVDTEESNSDSSEDECSKFELIKKARKMNHKGIKPSRMINIPDWTTLDREPEQVNFSVNSGIKINVKNKIEAFELFLPDSFYEMLVKETNAYHQQLENKGILVPEEIRNWADVTVSEMKKFMGLMLVFAYAERLELYDFWKLSPHWKMPQLEQIMTYNRYIDILKTLHFNNNAKCQDKENRYYKIQPLLDFFIPIFQKYYTPYCNLSLVQMLVPYKMCRFLWLYTPFRLLKFGVLLHTISELDSGYVWDVEIHDGEFTTWNDKVDKLLEPFVNKGYNVYMDRQYSGYNFTKQLLEKNIRVCGMVRTVNDLPSEFNNTVKELKRNDVVHCRQDDILLQGWRKISTIKMISTIHSSTFVKFKDRVKPQTMVDYEKHNKNMMLLQNLMYHYNFKGVDIKWTKRFFFWLFICALHNSYIVYRESKKRVMLTFRQYLYSYANYLITNN